MSYVCTSAFAVCRTIGLATYVVVVPSISWRSAGRFGARNSTRFWCSASVSVNSFAWLTIATAAWAFRPWLWASACICFSESLRIFRRRSEPMFWPFDWIGVAAPMWVAGAIAARSEPIVITDPADAARAPAGETYTITGTGDASSS